ncbi:hypothetical protein WS83_20435 [Burkholderia sp. MSMB2042]|nr:hypothetical protein WS78_11615 [Burkholderia savannae]KVG37447.1 hypothetical protein WS77_01845 [Burkholderia sp. MSMB0265]KVG88288.1 hypothetical protein WS81_25380 [Burkholderia sp. MSMB2040]KVG93840.1 hypothetical protein WS82_08875 [Burkholderia sp. MSMB2041]KVH01091.1 hypothetical protein WS83_20435 [Burkholderia sp. MSMB2042]KVK89893.1 hypothetical protein WS91_27460 [Burkholderia sp. MSMB1498]
MAGAISSTATSLTLSSAANLPSSIPASTALVITLNDRATQQQFEIIYATSISGATLSGLLRGQEGTTAQAWSTNDFAFSGPTAGQMQSINPGRLIGIQTFTTVGSTTYTPTPGMSFVIASCQAAGGGTGGVSAASATQISISGGACSGALAVGRFVAATIGSSQLITVGAGGLAGAVGNSLGGNGGNSSFGSLMTAQGGFGTQGFGPNGSTVFGVPGSGVQSPPTATGGNILNVSGEPGSMSIGGSTFGPSGQANAIGGPGGGSPIAGGGVGPGAGAAGVAIVGAAATAGNTGFNGIVLVYEYS